MAESSPGKFIIHNKFLLVVTFIFALLLGWTMGLFMPRPAEQGAQVSNNHSTTEKGDFPASWQDLTDLSEKELSRLGIARLNLLCAAGLPGAEDLTNEAILKKLNQWAGLVRSETERNFHRFYQNPHEFRSSEAFYRMGMLLTVLKQDCNMRYDEKYQSVIADESGNYGDRFFADPSRIFIHGILANKEGSCSSMPVLCAAVAAHLNYPVKLCSSKGHFFIRWEDKKERLNFETTAEGVVTNPDDYYKNWPHPISEAELARGEYLKSLNFTEMLSAFLAIRAECLRTHRKFPEALECFAVANRLAPHPNLQIGMQKNLLISKTTPPSRQSRGSIKDSIDTINELNFINRMNRQRTAHPVIPNK